MHVAEASSCLRSVQQPCTSASCVSGSYCIMPPLLKITSTSDYLKSETRQWWHPYQTIGLMTHQAPSESQHQQSLSLMMAD